MQNTDIDKLLLILREMNFDEYRDPITTGNTFQDLLNELYFFKKEKERKKKKIDNIIEHITNCFCGNFFNKFPISSDEDELDVICLGFNTYIEELQSVVVMKEELEEINTKLFLEKERSLQLSSAKDEFMSSMSHEIRTPLNAIIGFTNLLIQNKDITDLQKKQLNTIKKSGDLLMVIINDILNLSKIEAGQINLENISFDLSDTFQTIQDAFELRITEKNIAFQVKIDSKIPDQLSGDPNRYSQILINLISNAIKFTPNNGTIKVSFTLSREDELHHYIQFEIQDTGIGIPGHKISGIFEPFVQVSDDTARKYGGTGLGLAIVKKLTELMKGELDVQSEANIGTTIKVTIPFYKENRQASSSEYTKEENIVADKHVPSSNNQINILVAEDNLINQELVKAVLAFYNYNCIIAENGQQAIELLQENDFELILMDIMMPVLGGYEATEIIRKMTDKRKNSIPIIALTAIVTDSVTQKCQQIGFDAYLSKPFDPAELNQKIRDLVIK